MARYRLVIALLAPLLLYARTIRFDYVRADDVDLIAGNEEFLRDLRNVPVAFGRSYFETASDPEGPKTYYRPVTIVSFIVDAQRGADRPAAYHATNVLLHAFVTSLLVPVAQAWGATANAAIASALVFAVHPLNAQTVCWIAGRNDLLLASFTLLSLLAWRRRWTTLHVAAFALALFSKESGVVVPVLAVLDVACVRRRRLSRDELAAVAADLLVVAVWAGARAHALGATAGTGSSAEGAPTVVRNLPQLLVHTGKVLLPVRLNVSPGVDAAGLLIGVCSLVFLVAVLARRAPRTIAAFAGIWAAAFLLPSLVVPGLPAYEHRMYLPLVGLAIAIAQIDIDAKRGAIAAAAAAVLAAITVTRQDVFRNPFTYWTDATRDARFAGIAHVNLGQLYEAQERPDEARLHYQLALEIDPDTPKAHNNLGVVLMKLGHEDAARRQFLAETERHPSNADAWFNLGLWAEMNGAREEACRHWQRALAANPYYRPARDKVEENCGKDSR